jgi:hypothetical protein
VQALVSDTVAWNKLGLRRRAAAYCKAPNYLTAVPSITPLLSTLIFPSSFRPLHQRAPHPENSAWPQVNTTIPTLRLLTLHRLAGMPATYRDPKSIMAFASVDAYEHVQKNTPPWASVPQTKVPFFEAVRKTGETQAKDRAHILQLKAQAWGKRQARLAVGEIKA